MIEWCKAVIAEMWNDDTFSRIALILGLPVTIATLCFLVFLIGYWIIHAPLQFMIAIFCAVFITGVMMVIMVFDSHTFWKRVERRVKGEDRK